MGKIIYKTNGEYYTENISLRYQLIYGNFYCIFILVLIHVVLLMEQITFLFTKTKKLLIVNEGVIEDDEAKMLQMIFKLNDLTTTDLMTPRVVLIYLRGNATLAEYQRKIIKSEHNRILMIKESTDQTTDF